MELNSYQKNMIKGFIIGSLVGATAGIVFSSGFAKETRSGIKEALRESKHLYSDPRVKPSAVFKRAKRIFGGRDRNDEIIYRDLEEPDEFTAEA